MGYNEMDKVWDNSKATKTDKLVLLAIARRYKPGVGSWPSQDYLAKTCGVNIRSIRASLTRLEALGELTWIRGSNLSKKANLYYLTAIESAKTPAKSAKTSAQSDKNTRLLNKELNKLDAPKKLVFSCDPFSDFFRRVSSLRPDMSVLQVQEWLTYFANSKHAWWIEHAHTDAILLDKVLACFPRAEGDNR
jgi:hypothetical protein